MKKLLFIITAAMMFMWQPAAFAGPDFYETAYADHETMTDQAAFVGDRYMLASKGGSGDGGGQVENPWINIPPDTCASFRPADSDKSCVQDPSDQSGASAFCTTLVYCPKDTS